MNPNEGNLTILRTHFHENQVSHPPFIGFLAYRPHCDPRGPLHPHVLHKTPCHELEWKRRKALDVLK